MGSFSIWHWLLVLAVVLIFFGAGKLPRVMGDLAKGIKNFKSGMRDEGDQQAGTAPSSTQAVPPPAAADPARPAPSKDEAA
jgi:sec-independent protein translocase protein TatA